MDSQLTFDSLKLGLPDIDSQHKGLFHAFEVLHNANQGGLGSAQVGVLFLEMEHYVKRHFTFEEDMLEQHAWPGLPAHRILHAHIRDALHTYRQRLDATHIVQEAERNHLAQEVATFMRDWLMDHINREDRIYSLFLLEKMT